MSRRRPFRVRGAGLVLACLLSWPSLAWAQAASTTGGQVGPGTGNDWIDAHMLDMSAYAARYRDAFVDEIVRYHAAPRALVEAALEDGRLAAGEIYFACSLAQATGRPCRDVIEARRAAPASDWATLAAGLGVEPGSAIYRRIRGDISESYLRWARPLHRDVAR